MKSFFFKMACIFIIAIYILAPLGALDLNPDSNNKYACNGEEYKIDNGYADSDTGIDTEIVDFGTDSNDSDANFIDSDNGADASEIKTLKNGKELKSSNCTENLSNGSEKLGAVNPNLTISINDVYMDQRPTVEIHMNSSVSQTRACCCISNSGEGSHVFVSHDVTVKDGYAKLTFPETLPAGEYGIDCYTEPTGVFSEAEVSRKFFSRKHDPNLNVKVDNVVLGENPVVEIVSDKGLTGDVKVKIANSDSTYTTQIVNGYGNLTLDNIHSLGKYRCTVSYGGNNKYESSKKLVDFIVTGDDDPDLNIKVNDITVNRRALVEITANERLNGVVTVETNNSDTVHTVNMVKGHGSTTIEPINQEGNFSATVKYDGGNIFKKSQKSTNFSVYPYGEVDPNLTVDIIRQITQGDDLLVEIHTNETINDYADISISGPQQTFDDKQIKIVNGSGSLIIDEIGVPGNYFATVRYGGDDTFKPSVKTANFTVEETQNLIDPQFNIKVNDFDEGEKANVEITANNTLNGNADLYIINNSYYYNDSVKIVNGQANATIDNLSAGAYKAIVYFSGDKTFKHSSASTDFVVNERPNNESDDCDFKVILNDIYVGEDPVADIYINKSYKDSVFVSIFDDDGKSLCMDHTYPVDGHAQIRFDKKLSPGTYNFDAFTLWGTTRYYRSTFTVHKISPDLNIKVENINLGERAVFEINAHQNLKGNVSVQLKDLDDDNHSSIYTVNVEDGWGCMAVDNLSAGKYSATVSFAGDRDFESSEKTTSFAVWESDITKKKTK